VSPNSISLSYNMKGAACEGGNPCGHILWEFRIPQTTLDPRIGEAATMATPGQARHEFRPF